MTNDSSNEYKNCICILCDVADAAKLPDKETCFLIQSLTLMDTWVYRKHAGLCGKPDHVDGMLFIGIQRLQANSFPKTVFQPTVS